MVRSLRCGSDGGIVKRVDGPVTEKAVLIADQWRHRRQQLSPEQVHVCFEAGTERAFSGAYWNTKTAGVYRCAVCDAALFASEAKYDSGSGWPSFWQPVDGAGLSRIPDHSCGMVRVELRCARCGSHLGHEFGDGPAPTGKRYCINSAALNLVPAG